MESNVSKVTFVNSLYNKELAIYMRWPCRAIEGLLKLNREKDKVKQPSGQVAEQTKTV
jgi:hypothetical protein